MSGGNEHQRARLLLEERALGILGEADGEWLAGHLAGCAECEMAAQEMAAAIALLRSEPVTAPTFLVSRTRMNVRIRARELQESAERIRLLAISIGLALVWTALFAYAAFYAYATWGGALGVGAGGPLMWSIGVMWLWVAPAVLVAVALIRGQSGWLRALGAVGPESELADE